MVSFICSALIHHAGGFSLQEAIGVDGLEQLQKSVALAFSVLSISPEQLTFALLQDTLPGNLLS